MNEEEEKERVKRKRNTQAKTERMVGCEENESQVTELTEKIRNVME